MSDADVNEIRRRLDERKRTDQLDALWPDVPRQARVRALRRIRSVVEHVLRPSPGRPCLRADSVSERRALGIAGFVSGTGPLLRWWIDQGRIDASPDAKEALRPHLSHGRRRIARLRGHVAEIANSMRAAGVDPILLKGLHTGAEFFPHPATRPAADIDLLVRPADSGKARSVLGKLGFEETRRTVYSKRSEWTLGGAARPVRSLEFDHDENPWSVDLHDALERSYFRGTRRSLGDGAFATTRTVSIEDHPIRVLDEPYLTAFLAVHAGYSLANVQLVRLIELVFVMRADTARGALDWEQIKNLFAATDTGRFAYPALALAEGLAPGTVEPRWLERAASAATARTHRVLRAVRGANLGPLTHRGFDVKLAHARGVRELVMNLSEVVLPSDDGLPVSLVRLQAQRLAALMGRRSRWRQRERARQRPPPERERPADVRLVRRSEDVDAATALPPAVRAFDATAARFDERFGAWLSVAAQRAAVRRHLLRTFPPGSRLLELGAGTAEDAIFMLQRGYDVTVTDGSPAMVTRAGEKIAAAGYADRRVPRQVVLERIAAYAREHRREGSPRFDGVYSNFAAFNCIEDPREVGPALASLVRPGGACVLVVFGRCAVGEVVVECARGRPKEAMRRRRKGPAAARIGNEEFSVWYPSARTLARALAPWFQPSLRRGIGILVPPSAAEPWISSHPRLVSALAAGDRLLAAPLWFLGDHVLLTFERSSAPAST